MAMWHTVRGGFGVAVLWLTQSIESIIGLPHLRHHILPAEPSSYWRRRSCRNGLANHGPGGHISTTPNGLPRDLDYKVPIPTGWKWPRSPAMNQMARELTSESASPWPAERTRRVLSSMSEGSGR
jgi:hypothetical protein